MSVYILSGKRTPVGSFLGGLKTVSATKLGAIAISAALDEINVNKDDIDELFMGQVLSAGVGQAPARQASLEAGLSSSIPTTTINKVCGSGLKAIITAVQGIKCGDIDLAIAGGMENMSMAPHLIPQGRSGVKYGDMKVTDHLAYDALTDPGSGESMGILAENCPIEYELSRDSQDEYAIRSFMRAQKAIASGIFKDEIAPVTIQSRKGETIIIDDEGPALVKFDKIKKLRPAFISNGTLTAANSSTINDGAAALVIGSDKFKDQAEFEVIGYSSYAHDPKMFATAPIGAIKKLLSNVSMSIEDIDLFEINEAFACVPMSAIKEFDISEDRVNIYGSGVSLGHPVGTSGARIVVTLMTALKKENKSIGLASLCIGGGEALAIIIKRL